MHRGIVDAGSLVNIDVESVVGLHLERRLHTGFREHCHRRVSPVDRIVETTAYLGESRLLRLLLLRVVVAGKPPCLVVARHGKLGFLLLDDEIIEFALLGELIAQPHAVVIDTEADDHVTRVHVESTSAFTRPGCHLTGFPLLAERDGQLVVVVADSCGFSPHRGPRLVECRLGSVGNPEVAHQVVLVLAVRGMFSLGQLEPEMTRTNHRLALVGHFILRTSVIQ